MHVSSTKIRAGATLVGDFTKPYPFSAQSCFINLGTTWLPHEMPKLGVCCRSRTDLKNNCTKHDSECSCVHQVLHSRRTLPSMPGGGLRHSLNIVGHMVSFGHVPASLGLGRSYKCSTPDGQRVTYHKRANISDHWLGYCVCTTASGRSC